MKYWFNEFPFWLLNSKTRIFLLIWYKIYFQIIFCNFFRDKIWIKVLQIMKHNRDFLATLRFKLHTWCADPQYFSVAWLWSCPSPSSYIILYMQHSARFLIIFMIFSSHKKRFITADSMIWILLGFGRRFILSIKGIKIFKITVGYMNSAFVNLLKFWNKTYLFYLASKTDVVG